MNDADNQALRFELPWPRPGDSPFSDDSDSWHEVATVSHLSPGFWDRIIAFKRAGDVLVEHALSDRRDIDFLVSPIVYCYRHYLELELKELVTLVRRAERRQLEPWRGHRLEPLWRELRAFAEKDPITYGMPATKIVALVIGEFERVDAGSAAFRYGIGKSGEKLLPSDLRKINVRNLAEVMERTEAYLDGFGEAVSAQLDAADEESPWI